MLNNKVSYKIQNKSMQQNANMQYIPKNKYTTSYVSIPPPAKPTPSQSPLLSNNTGYISSSIIQGLGFGVGSAIGHHAINSVMCNGPKNIHPPTIPASVKIENLDCNDAKMPEDCKELFLIYKSLECIHTKYFSH
jgi:hypothetical protein